MNDEKRQAPSDTTEHLLTKTDMTVIPPKAYLTDISTSNMLTDDSSPSEMGLEPAISYGLVGDIYII